MDTPIATEVVASMIVVSEKRHRSGIGTGLIMLDADWKLVIWNRRVPTTCCSSFMKSGKAFAKPAAWPGKLPDF